MLSQLNRPQIQWMEWNEWSNKVSKSTLHVTIRKLKRWGAARNSKLSDRTTNTEHRWANQCFLFLFLFLCSQSVSVSFWFCFPDLLCFKNRTETETETDSQRKQLKMAQKEEYRTRNRNRNRFTTQAIKTLQEKLCGLLIHYASDLRWPSLIACVVNMFLFLYLHL